MIQKHKYLTLDAIRGVAAIFVLTRHAGELLGGWQFLHSYLAVDLFFVMSGFVISVAYDEGLSSKKLSVIEFLKIRTIRLYPLYFLALMFSILLTVHYAIHHNDAFNWTGLSVQILLGLILIPSPFPGTGLFPLNGPSWSIFFEVIANALYAKFKFHLTKKVLLSVMVVSALMLTICVLMKHNMDFGFNWKNGIGGFPRVMYSFWGGVLIYQIRKKLQFGKIFNPWISLLMLLIVMLLLSMPVKVYTEIYDLMVVLIVFPILVLFSTYIEPTRNTTLEKIYSVLGMTSYAIYIFQAPFVWAYSGIFMKHGFTSMLSGIIAVFVLFSLSLLLDFFYDQPIRRWLRNKFLVATK